MTARQPKPIRMLITSPRMSETAFDMAKTQEERNRYTETLLRLMDTLSRNNEAFIRAHPSFPRLYDSPVQYTAQDPNEEWQDAFTTLTRKTGDCEDLACWRIGELRAAGVPAKPFITWRQRPDGSYLYHALVWRGHVNSNLPPGIAGIAGTRSNPRILRPSSVGRGFIEDPSRVKGMH